MRITRFIFVTLVLFFLSAGSLFAQKQISASEARQHVGEVATVCGHVASSHFAASTRGQPTFLNLDQPYPSQVFTILIWGSDRSRFGRPEDDYRNKQVCVTGKISAYRGTPEIIATDPNQIRIETQNKITESTSAPITSSGMPLRTASGTNIHLSDPGEVPPL
jgi:hypothetical protein